MYTKWPNMAAAPRPSSLWEEDKLCLRWSLWTWTPSAFDCCGDLPPSLHPLRLSPPRPVLTLQQQERPPPWRVLLMNNEPTPGSFFWKNSLLSGEAVWQGAGSLLLLFIYSCSNGMGQACSDIFSSLNPAFHSPFLPALASLQGLQWKMRWEAKQLDCPSSSGWRSQRWKWDISPMPGRLPVPPWQRGLSGIQVSLPWRRKAGALGTAIAWPVAQAVCWLWAWARGGALIDGADSKWRTSSSFCSATPVLPGFRSTWVFFLPVPLYPTLRQGWSDKHFPGSLIRLGNMRLTTSSYSRAQLRPPTSLQQSSIASSESLPLQQAQNPHSAQPHETQHSLECKDEAEQRST